MLAFDVGRRGTGGEEAPVTDLDAFVLDWGRRAVSRRGASSW